MAALSGTSAGHEFYAADEAAKEVMSHVIAPVPRGFRRSTSTSSAKLLKQALISPPFAHISSYLYLTGTAIEGLSALSPYRYFHFMPSMSSNNLVLLQIRVGFRTKFLSVLHHKESTSLYSSKSTRTLFPPSVANSIYHVHVI